MASICPDEIELLLAEFSNQGESRKTEQSQAMQCRDLEDILVLGIALHLSISMVDHNWHDSMFSGRVEYNSSEEQEIAAFYREWLRTAEILFSRIAEMEAANYEVRWAKEFRRAYRTAKGTQTPDAEFFSGDPLVDLRDQAIDAHRGGRTVEFHELGD